jgi:hypothetical protein
MEYGIRTVLAFNGRASKQKGLGFSKGVILLLATMKTVFFSAAAQQIREWRARSTCISKPAAHKGKAAQD